MKQIGILGLSDPCSRQRVTPTIQWLKELGYPVRVSPYLYQESTPQQRASIWNRWLTDDVDYIFDVSGGDLANQTIPYLDLRAYRKSKSVFHGYSDLTCVLNVLAPVRRAVLFQICQNTHRIDIEKYISGQDNDLFVGHAMGGNIRCLLKLAGTPYFPDLKGQSLFLESRSGSIQRIQTYFTQLEMMGVFSQIADLILGQFTQLDQEGQRKALYEITKKYPFRIKEEMAVGHSIDSKALRLEVNHETSVF